MTRVAAHPLHTDRLELEPLTVGHADEMVAVLADPALYTVTGGGPPTLDELRDRYARQVAGPAPPEDGQPPPESWLNWVVRRRDTAEPVGFVQATVVADQAELAWVLGTAQQGHGFATEAARAVATALTTAGVHVLSAYVAPGHNPSEAVARRLGLAPTDERADGEVRWVRQAPG